MSGDDMTRDEMIEKITLMTDPANPEFPVHLMYAIENMDEVAQSIFLLRQATRWGTVEPEGLHSEVISAGVNPSFEAIDELVTELIEKYVDAMNGLRDCSCNICQAANASFN